MASDRSRANRSLGNKINNHNSRIAAAEKGTPNPHLALKILKDAHIANKAILADSIADRAITEDKVARGAIGTEHIGVVTQITSDSGLSLVTGDGAHVTLDGPSYIPAPSGSVQALGFDEYSNVVVSTLDLAALLASSTPSGNIEMTARATPPAGYLPCVGGSYSIYAYPELFEAIGYAYGGSGGNFTMPNMKGRVPVGLDAGDPNFDTLGEKGGEQTHVLTEAEMPSHSHASPTASAATTGAVEVPPISSIAGYSEYDYIGGAPTSVAGSDAAHNNLQPYIVLNYIIKT